MSLRYYYRLELIPPTWFQKFILVKWLNRSKHYCRIKLPSLWPHWLIPITIKLIQRQLGRHLLDELLPRLNFER